jgi:hypothetical protein
MAEERDMGENVTKLGRTIMGLIKTITDMPKPVTNPDVMNQLRRLVWALNGMYYTANLLLSKSDFELLVTMTKSDKESVKDAITAFDFDTLPPDDESPEHWKKN